MSCMAKHVIDAWAGAGCIQAKLGREQGGAGQIVPVAAFMVLPT